MPHLTGVFPTHFRERIPTRQSVQPAWHPLVLAPSKVYKGHPERPQSSKEIWDYLWRVRPCCVWTTGSSDYEWPFAPFLNTVTCTYTSKLWGASKSTRRCDKASLPVQLSSSFFFWLKPENITPMLPFFEQHPYYFTCVMCISSCIVSPRFMPE